jgi:F0F1-type ATP synthase membrane subunit b/b'
MTTSGWTISSWQDVAILVGVLGTLFALLGGVVTTAYTNRKSKIEKQSADDAASDRLLRLVEQESEKKIEIVRTEFRLIIADMELKHRDELTAMRLDFEAQLKTLRKDNDTYRCELAPVCSWRNKKTPPPPAIRLTKTDA